MSGQACAEMSEELVSIHLNPMTLADNYSILVSVFTKWISSVGCQSRGIQSNSRIDADF